MTPAAPPSPAPVNVRTWPTFVRLLRRFRPRARATAGVLCLHLLRSAFDLATPVLLGYTAASLDGRGGAGGTLPAAFTTLLAALSAVIALHAVLQWSTAMASARLGQDLENRLRSELFAKVLR